LKGEPAAAKKLSWPQVHAFRLERHHLARRAPKKDLARVVGEIGGVQAQVMSAAELQVGIRADCRVEDVRDALWKRKTLVKTWLMRGTLHLVPAADLPLFTAAMQTRWMHLRNSWLKWVQMSEPEFWGVVDAISHALEGEALTREELIQKVVKGRPEHVREAMKSGWGGMLKPVARRGLLCFGPSRGQSVTFVRPEQWLGTWRQVDPDEALVEVARRYLRAYGPATKADFARWWGNWPGVGSAAWAGLAAELVRVSVEGQPADVLASDLHVVARQPDTTSPVQLLPPFDPYLMGHSKRDHLFDAIHSPKVSRAAGWISAVVLVDGRVSATWSHVSAKGILLITVKPFERLAPKTEDEIGRRAQLLAQTLGLEKVEIRIA